jgi:hypothetical protein
MPISPLIPILCLLAGAFLMAVSALVRFRWPSLIMAVAAGLAVASMLPLQRQLPVSVAALDWRPVTLVGSPVSLRVDSTAWLLGLALLVAGFAVSLTWQTVPTLDETPSTNLSRALALAMLAVGLGSVFAANILTLAISWGLLDGLFCLILLARGGSSSGRRAQVALGLNGLATLSVWLVAVLIEQDHLSPYWHLLVLPVSARGVMGLAAALRLGLYPLNIWQPVELVSELDRAILVYLVPVAAGLSLWARLAVMQALPEGSVWPTIALITALIGGVQAWLQLDPRESLPHIALGYGGMLILAATRGRLQAEALAAGAASWLLGLTLLFVGRSFGRSTWPWAIPSALGAATLAGLPLTLGFVSRSAFYRGVSEVNGPLVLALVAESLLIGAMLRRLSTPDDSPLPSSLLAKVGYGAALVVGAAPLLAGVIAPAALMAGLSAAMWLAWSIPLVGALVLAVVAGRLHSTINRLGGVTGQVIRLDWLYSILLPMLRSPARLGLMAADLLEGEGAFLWMLVILALVLLYVRG